MKKAFKQIINKFQRWKFVKRYNNRMRLNLPFKAIVNWKAINLAESSNFSLGEESIIRGSLQCQKEGASLKVGNRCFLGAGSTIVSTSEVEILDNVLISHNCYITDTAGHSLDPSIRKRDIPNRWSGYKDWSVVASDPIIIESDVWIGPNVIILRGLKIGQAAVVAAGSVVTKDVSPNCLVAGVPAKTVKKLEFE